MTPEQKAREMVSAYIGGAAGSDTNIRIMNAKGIALLAVHEIIDWITLHPDEQSSGILFWTDVKNEIEKL